MAGPGPFHSYGKERGPVSYCHDAIYLLFDGGAALGVVTVKRESGKPGGFGSHAGTGRARTELSSRLD